jgi:two-component system OmpR family response regulator
MADNGTRVLVVDDEASITDLVALALRYEGFTVEKAATGRAALASVGRFKPDLIVLDVMLPDLSGLDVLRRLSADGRRVPVIFLTARDATEDKVHGLTVGGDDYVTKPFSIEELVARVRAVLRRHGDEGEKNSKLTFADLELDDDAHEVRRAGELIELTPTEYRLLRYLLANAGRVLTRNQILDHVWDYDFGGSSTVVATYIAYLRRKLAACGPDVIHTQRGVGYSLRLPREQR